MPGRHEESGTKSALSRSDEESTMAVVRFASVNLGRVNTNFVIIGVSSYLLDATSPSRLWFHQFCERNRLHLNSLLRQPVEEFAA
jgi:hypothetical protein